MVVDPDLLLLLLPPHIGDALVATTHLPEARPQCPDGEDDGLTGANITMTSALGLEATHSTGATNATIAPRPKRHHAIENVETVPLHHARPQYPHRAMRLAGRTDMHDLLGLDSGLGLGRGQGHGLARDLDLDSDMMENQKEEGESKEEEEEEEEAGDEDEGGRVMGGEEEEGTRRRPRHQIGIGVLCDLRLHLLERLRVRLLHLLLRLEVCLCHLRLREQRRGRMEGQGLATFCDVSCY